MFPTNGTEVGKPVRSPKTTTGTSTTITTHFLVPGPPGPATHSASFVTAPVMSSARATSLLATKTTPGQIENAFMRMVDEASPALLARLLSSSENKISGFFPNSTKELLVAAKLSSLLASAGAGVSSIKVSLSSGLDVFVPVSLLDRLPNEEVAMVGAGKVGWGSSPAAVGGGVDVVTAAVVELRLMSGEPLPISELVEPIEISLPLTSSDAIQCAYWDEKESAWSRRGLFTKPPVHPGDNVACQTTHLSLFGAVGFGAVSTVNCARYDALYRAQFGTKWYGKHGSIVCWTILSILFAMFTVAACLDRSRRSSFQWSNEFFLIAVAPRQRSRNLEEGEEDEDDLQLARTSFRTGCCRCFHNLVSNCKTWLGQSSAVREALDDLGSTWFEYFSELRSLCGGIYASLEDGELHQARQHTSWVYGAFVKILNKLLILSSRRLAGSSMWCSDRLVSFVISDKELKEYLTDLLDADGSLHHSSTFRSEPSTVSTPSIAAAPVPSAQSSSTTATRSLHHIRSSRSTASFHSRSGEWRLSRTQEEAWRMLHDEVVHHVSQHTYQQGSTRLLGTMCRLLMVQNPLSAAFVFDIFQSAKQRVLLLTADLTGAMALSCLFFEASGFVRGGKDPRLAGGQKSNNSECGMGLYKGIGERAGRFAIIAAGCVLVAGLPVLILESLQTKGFRRIEGEPRCRAWRRQLRVWAIQEVIFWTFGILYIAFCIYYTVLFIGDLSDREHREWSIANSIAFAQDFLVLPLVVSVLVPMIVRGFLQCHSRFSRIAVRDIIRKAGEVLHQNGNVMLPIAQI